MIANRHLQSGTQIFRVRDILYPNRDNIPKTIFMYTFCLRKLEILTHSATWCKDGKTKYEISPEGRIFFNEIFTIILLQLIPWIWPLLITERSTITMWLLVEFIQYGLLCVVYPLEIPLRLWEINHFCLLTKKTSQPHQTTSNFNF